MDEEWRPVQDYSDVFVSNLGEVRKGDKKLAIRPDRNGRAMVSIWTNGVGAKIYMRYTLMAQAFIPNPENKPEVDHKNGDHTDDRLENLRWATRSENTQNTRVHKDNVVGFKGVSIKPGIRNKRYSARIYHEGKTIRLGNFYTPQEAHAVYIAKAKELHGEYFREI